MSFRLISGYKPTGDQPQAIEKLAAGVKAGQKSQVLLGVTGSGKTFTIANVIQVVQKPTLVIAHNKTLAAQLYQEFKEFFPENSVNYFVSYYDFYQPEAYLPQTDTYIEKETDINEEIDKLRLQATSNLLSRKDVIVVSSVSCIYNLGNPKEYQNATLVLKSSSHSGATRSAAIESSKKDPIASLQDDKLDRREIMEKLVEMQYLRNDFDFRRGTFRLRGEILDIYPSYGELAVRIEFDENDSINRLIETDSLTGEKVREIEQITIYPAKHYMTDPKKYAGVFEKIREDMEERVAQLTKSGKLLEAQRLKSRVTYDLEMIAEVGYVNGIENYSRYFDGRSEGDPPYSLLEYFPKDYLLIIDESHMTVPQIRGMYNGDRSRKQTLIDFGFRLPAALDNRPLRFEEFQRRMGQTIFTSATPDKWEISNSSQVVEQLVRPTGLVDPQVEVRKTEGQIEDLIVEIRKQKEEKGRVLVTTLTKRMAEELSDYLESQKIKVNYLHSDVENINRTDILKKLREGEFDVVVGINLLREGLDLPEVSLVAIIDADKEGFLRSKTSLIQTMGRAARHIHGKVIMYADNVTKSMQEAIDENNRRRDYQLKWNKEHGVTPTGIIKPIRENVLTQKKGNPPALRFSEVEEIDMDQLTPEDKAKLKKVLEKRMKEAAKILDFEGATHWRDRLKQVV
jgi:excinuclease ABC subunit B